MSALGSVLTKLISGEVEKLIIMFYLGLAYCIFGTIGLFTVGQPSIPEYEEWLLAIAIGLLGLLQQYALVWAVQVCAIYVFLLPPLCVFLYKYSPSLSLLPE